MDARMHALTHACTHTQHLNTLGSCQSQIKDHIQHSTIYNPPGFLPTQGASQFLVFKPGEFIIAGLAVVMKAGTFYDPCSYKQEELKIMV